MSRPPINRNSPGKEDALLQRYEEANTLDPARPGDALRDNVLAHARSQAAKPGGPPAVQQSAANDSQWKLRALGSLAVMGLVGLLVMQFEQGSPEEQEIAMGAPTPRADSALVMPKKSPPPASTSGYVPEPPEAPVAPSATQPHAEPPPKRLEASAPPSPALMRPAPAAKAASPVKAETPMAAEEATPVGAAEQAEAMEAPQAMARAAPAAAMDAAPDMAQAEAASPMASAPSAARERQAVGRSSKASRQDTTAGNSALEPAPSGSPLHAAVVSGNVKEVQKLLGQGAAVDARDPLGRTPLMLAAMGTARPMVEALINAGANAKLRDNAGLSAADHAVQAGHADWLPLFNPPQR